MSLASAKLIAEILELASRVYGTVADKELARKNQERDDKIRKLEQELKELKEKASKP